MATAIILCVLVIACALGVKSTVKRVSGGCCGGGDVEKKIRLEDGNPKHYEHHAEVTIEGMRCMHCETKVHNALNGKSNLMAKVSVEKGTAQVYSHTPIEENIIKEIILETGYQVTNIHILS